MALALFYLPLVFANVCHFANSGKNSFRSAHLCSLSSCGAPPNPFAHIMRVNNVEFTCTYVYVGQPPACASSSASASASACLAGVCSNCPAPPRCCRRLSFPLLLISAALISSPHQGHIARIQLRVFKSASGGRLLPAKSLVTVQVYFWIIYLLSLDKVK